MKYFIIFALVFVSLLGCSRAPSAQQACEDDITAMADAMDRCGIGVSFDSNRDALEAAFHGCGSVTSVRDEDELYYQCIPSLSVVLCSNLEKGDLDSSCDQQLNEGK